MNPLQRLPSVRLTSLLTASLAALTLLGATGCAPLVVGGAVAGGALIATDRRTSGAQLDDEGIELRSNSRLSAVAGSHINVTSYNRQVLLTGEVPTEKDKAVAEQIVRQVDNVRNVLNELSVMPSTSYTQRSSDAVVTGRVKAALVDARDLQSNAFKVVTERGVVYMMGRVTPHEATRGTDVVRNVTGVQRVVRAMEILTEDEVRSLSGDVRVKVPAAAASEPAKTN